MPNLSGIEMGMSVDMSVRFSPTPVIMAAGFDTLGVNVKSFKEPLTRAVRDVMRSSLQTNFDVGGRPEPWQPLADATIKRKGHDEILVDTGALRRTAGTISMWTIDREKAVIDALPQRVWYGAVHQVGTGSGDIFSDEFTAGIPARPWAVIQDEDAVEIEDIFLNWIDERINRDIAAGRRASYDLL